MIENNRFMASTLASPAIRCTGCDGALIANNVIVGVAGQSNTAHGIRLSSCTRSFVVDNRVLEMSSGIVADGGSSHLTLERNLVSGADSIGLDLSTATYSVLRQNAVVDAGLWAVTVGGANNIIDNNEVSGAHSIGIRITISGNTYVNNRVIGGTGYSVVAGNKDGGGNI